MDNPKTLATIDTQDTGQRKQTNKSQNTTQKTDHELHQRPGINPGAWEVPSSDKTPSMLLI